MEDEKDSCRYRKDIHRGSQVEFLQKQNKLLILRYR
jgi:hypothetical protein